MQTTIIAGTLLSVVAAGSPLFAQSSADEVAQLRQRVVQLEKQVQEISRLVEPLKAQQSVESRRNTLREKFEEQMAQDRKKYSPEQLREAERLYQVGNQKWGTSEATESLQTMIKKFPDINRTGCAVMYIAQNSEGDERIKHLKDCIEKYGDCFYGDGVQVGAYARLLLADTYQSKGEQQKAAALYSEIRRKYADAVDHNGALLVDQIQTRSK